MKTNVEALQDNQVKLTVTLTADEIDTRIKKVYKDFSYKYNFPGFRRGKAPRPIIDSAFGAEAVLATVTDEAIKETYPLAVDESGIYPIAQPEFEDQDALVKGGKDFSFAATLSVKPELDLENYESVEIELPSEETTDEEIEMQIEALREHYFTFEDASASTKIAEGGAVELAMTAADDKGESIDSLTSESRLYMLGSGLYPAEFDEALIGMKKGQKKEIDLEFKGLYTAGLASIAGKTDKVHFEIEVKEVKKKVLPEVTEEWAKETCGFEGLDDLKTRITESITQSKQEALPRMKENKCLDALSERLKGEVPASMLENTEADLLQTFFRQLQGQGASLDAYLKQQDITMEQFKEDVKKQALETTKQDLALDAWARHKKMTATDKEVSEEFTLSGSDNPKALEEEWRTNGQLHTIRQGILRVKAMKDLFENAKVTELKIEETPKKTAPKKTASKKNESAQSSDKKKPAKKTTDSKEEK